MTRQEFRKLFPPRGKDSHKGDFGKIFILAGSWPYPGAPYLTSMGALRSGAGLITLGVPQSIYLIEAIRLTEVMVRPFEATTRGFLSPRAGKEIADFLKTQDVLVLGPGLGQERETQELIRILTIASEKTCVLDADGLNAFHQYQHLLKKRKAGTILTPHPGEAERLFGTAVPKNEEGRKKYARETALRYRCVLVLKGHHTVIAGPGGEVCVNPTGNPGLATGGSGDLLTGMIGAFLGQKLKPFDAARAAVYLHGYAADLAVEEFGEISLTPTDVLSYLPRAFRKLLK